jgi:hypothetical protein
MTSHIVYVLDSGMGTQKDVLRRLTDSDWADAMAGWCCRVMSAWLSAGRHACEMLRSRLPQLRWHKRCPGRYWPVWMRGGRRERLMALSSNRAVPAQSHVRANRCIGLL